MPRRNRTRDVLAEEHLAQRVQAERERRGWTNEGLAKRMADIGCPMSGSAIFKIEKGEPRRRIVVDELVGFSRVFKLPVTELLIPPDLAVSKEFVRLLDAWAQALADGREAEARAGEAFRTLRGVVREELDRRPDVEWTLARVLASMVTQPPSGQDRVWHAMRMKELTGSDFWESVWLRHALEGWVEALSDAGKRDHAARSAEIDPIMNQFWDSLGGTDG